MALVGGDYAGEAPSYCVCQIQWLKMEAIVVCESPQMFPPLAGNHYAIVPYARLVMIVPRRRFPTVALACLLAGCPSGGLLASEGSSKKLLTT